MRGLLKFRINFHTARRRISGLFGAIFQVSHKKVRSPDQADKEQSTDTIPRIVKQVRNSHEGENQ